MSPGFSTQEVSRVLEGKDREGKGGLDKADVVNINYTVSGI